MNVTDVPTIEITEAARILGVCWKTANKWVHSGKLQARKIGGRYKTTAEWIEAVAEPVMCHQPTPTKAQRERTNEIEACRKRIEARFGIKVSGSKMRRIR